MSLRATARGRTLVATLVSGLRSMFRRHSTWVVAAAVASVIFNGCAEEVTVSFGASASDEGTDATKVGVGEGVTVLRVVADIGQDATVRVENGSGASVLIDVPVPEGDGAVPIGILPPDCPE